MTVSPIANPYHIAGPIHNPAHFFGRNEQLRRILESAWQHHQSTNIVGEAQSGKTSLLFRILDPDTRARFVPEDRQSVYVYLNPELCSEPGTFYRLVLQGVEKEVPGLFHVSQTGLLNEEDMQTHLRALLPQHLVLLIDNFEQMCDCNHFNSDFFNFLRGLATHTEFYMTMVIASRKHIHELCPSEVLASRFHTIFAEVRLGAFTPDEFDEFIQQTSSYSGAPIAQAREEILRLAGYYPYLAQMACAHIYDLWRRKGQLEPEDMATIRREFRHDARAHFQMLWTRHLSAPERRVLSALVQGEEIAAEAVLEDPESQDLAVETVLGDLEAKGYLADGAITSQCFADFVVTQLDESVTASHAPSSSQTRERGIRLDQHSGDIYINGRKLVNQLSPLQYKLLAHLCQNKGQVCVKDDLILAGWDTIDGVSDEALAQQISRLRKLLDGGKRYILTVNRWGYKMVDSPEREP
jgi:DNA-binding winged helix-turn-helix (wHTH) protein